MNGVLHECNRSVFGNHHAPNRRIEHPLKAVVFEDAGPGFDAIRDGVLADSAPRFSAREQRFHDAGPISAAQCAAQRCIELAIDLIS
jgi:hypothetical protein